MPKIAPPTARLKRFADHETALPRNVWYVAGRSAETTAAPTPVTILGEDVILLRDPTGRAVALSDRCPHRGYPMHLGRIGPDGLTCGYHGIRYGFDGRCLSVPSQARPPKGISLPSYVTHELGPWLWCCIGQPPTPAPLPSLESRWVSAIDGFQPVEASYIGLHESLIDLSSFAFLLKDLVGGPDYARAPIVVRTDGQIVQVERTIEATRLPPFYDCVIGDVGLVRRRTVSRFLGPGLQSAESEITAGDGRVYRTLILHALTPVNSQRSLYHWWILRDFKAPTRAGEDPQRPVATAIFGAIARTLEKIGVHNPGEAERRFGAIHLSSDQAGLEVRHIIQKVAQAEAARPASP
jgi:nitrite reductase/ring-hydroxylating ferredoxin subunit